MMQTLLSEALPKHALGAQMDPSRYGAAARAVTGHEGKWLICIQILSQENRSCKFTVCLCA